MVRLLQIAGVGALLVAGVVLASLNPWRPVGLLHLGISSDPDATRFLNAEGAVARFNARKDSQVSDDQDKTPPLVKQAQTLESILNPRVPPPAAAAAASTRAPSTAVLRPPSSAKFELIGISYLPPDPENSFAYIHLPDNTFQWVRQGSEVGHLTIKQVKQDSIICSDGQRLSEMKVGPVVDTASLLEGGGITAGSPPVSARLNAEDEAGLNELVHRLKQELGPSKGNQADSGTASAKIDKLISEAKSSISEEEAQKLEKLGEQLNSSPEEKRREAMRRMSPVRPPKQ